MAYSAMQVANSFIQRAKDGAVTDLTPMKLQKLMFFAQSWSLKETGYPLFDDFFSRWQYGPVIPSIYHEFKSFRDQPITSYGIDVFGNTVMVSEDDPQSWELIDDIIKEYGEYSASQLSWMTHQPKTAWSMNDILGTVITNLELYKGKV
ncbi:MULTISPECIES: Panacea domain-containing protein [Pasteurella]|uniref:Antitoxin SocA-like Panacea domain-containing protein n=1 Tax=Pasteurella dagmatis ATCC 43325 TaxID=667128 RepID=C9PSG5_9PAST|nr:MULTISPECIES: type II toxin-antitoxin system antitoxin SocA domain-containing protein [Pasteurella]EEX49486.1 hypothetical protein HMPREF0621_1939 [Pasteurella dagmatis ATCC 43325]QDA12848.1 DUF4065 domain-containing protein [Pasteurella multocida subsp. multocida]SNV82973.1 Uncharacterized phage-associated protein [Pasteurella dagmatis]HDR1924203.1 DUF4065 domain-containing protein [Pasteurella multocida]